MTPPTQGEHAQTEALDDLYLKLHGMSKRLESSGRIDESDAPEAYPAILDAMNLVRRLQSEAAQVPATTAQPTQAPAGAVPLTEQQMDAIWEECKFDNGDEWSIHWTSAVRAAERLHGIKGADHG